MASLPHTVPTCPLGSAHPQTRVPGMRVSGGVCEHLVLCEGLLFLAARQAAVVGLWPLPFIAVAGTPRAGKKNCTNPHVCRFQLLCSVVIH